MYSSAISFLWLYLDPVNRDIAPECHSSGQSFNARPFGIDLGSSQCLIASRHASGPRGIFGMMTFVIGGTGRVDFIFFLRQVLPEMCGVCKGNELGFSECTIDEVEGNEGGGRED